MSPKRRPNPHGATAKAQTQESVRVCMSEFQAEYEYWEAQLKGKFINVIMIQTASVV
jgi:hypothetical protein